MPFVAAVKNAVEETKLRSSRKMMVVRSDDAERVARLAELEPVDDADS